MKIVCLLGSPHGVNGNTFRLLDWVVTGAGRRGAEVETVLLDGLSVLPCLGCDSCHRTGDCPQQDSFGAIRGLLEEADGVVLASPNYIGSVTAQLKAFMDRCSGMIHCLSLSGKYGLSVVTSGGGEDEPVTEFMNRFLLMTGVRPVGSVHASMAALAGGEFGPELRAQAQALGETLVESWREGRTDLEVERRIAEVRSRMRQLVVWKGDEWPFEYAYWQEHHGVA